MGSDDFYPEERPAHVEHVGAFEIDVHPVTNAEFRRFVADTGYLTTAESAPTAEDFPDAALEELVPGSLVFRATDGPVPLNDWRRWWSWEPGAGWQAPDGPASSLRGRGLHPVVHVSYEDALAYAVWAGKRLPTEVEWEYAARAGGPATPYAWGTQFMPGGKPRANTWQGRFPWRNDEAGGRDRTTPVGRFAPNGWGLIDMIGNVWEWTSTPWTADHGGRGSEASHACCAPTLSSADDGLQEIDRRVMKGGSHLCSPDYCKRYRPAARQGQAVRSSTSHLGFRCVVG
jgi:formylglycine-generating enzyme required for sulfatase activity